MDGEAQDVTRDKDVLKSSIRTESVLNWGRDVGSVVEDVAVQDLRIYGRVLSAAEVRDVAFMPRLKFFAAKTAGAAGHE